MKKLAKIVAGLLLGLVVVAGVKTEAKAYTQADLLKALGYSQSAYSNPYVNYYGLSYTGLSAYDQYITNYAEALYMYNLASDLYEYMGNLNNYFTSQYMYLYNLAEATQPYVYAYGGSNPYYLAMNDYAAQYQNMMNQFYATLNGGFNGYY